MSLDIDKEELKKRFIAEDWDYVFEKAYQISGFLISYKFKILDKDVSDDMKQECVENLLKKISEGKVKPESNVFSFIWKNSIYRILEILRKDRNREKIARFIPYEVIDYEIYKHEEITEKYDPEYCAV